MKQEELLNQLECSFEAFIEEKDIAKNVAKCFFEKIDIPYDCIKGVERIDDFEWRDGSIDFNVYFTTNNGLYSIFKECKLHNEIELKMHVMNAINNFTQWSADFTFDNAYLKNDVVMISFKEDDLIDVSLKGHFEDVRDRLIDCMSACCQEWKGNNVQRWNDYAYYLLPVLRVLDEIEKGVKLYN